MGRGGKEVIIRLTQSSLAEAGTELGKNVNLISENNKGGTFLLKNIKF